MTGDTSEEDGNDGDIVSTTGVAGVLDEVTSHRQCVNVLGQFLHEPGDLLLVGVDVEAVRDDKQDTRLGQVEGEGIRLDAGVAAVQVGTERAHDAARPLVCERLFGGHSAGADDIDEPGMVSCELVSAIGTHPVGPAITKPTDGDALAFDEYTDGGSLRRWHRLFRLV